MITEVQGLKITEALTQAAVRLVQDGSSQHAPETLQTIRRALVDECAEVNRATVRLVQEGSYQRAPEILQTIRRALVDECGELNCATRTDASADSPRIGQ